MKSDDVATRRAAARALGRIGPAAKTAAPLLDLATADKDPGVRQEAALAHWRVTGQRNRLIVLIQLLPDPPPAVRDAGCQALAAMQADAAEAVDVIALLLGEKELRLRAVMTLGAIGAPARKIEPALRKLLEDRDSEVQLRAAFALWQITGDAKTSLKVINETLATEEQYTQSIVLLGEMGQAARPLLQTLVNLYRFEDVPADRLALAEAIQKIDPALAKKLGIR